MRESTGAESIVDVLLLFQREFEQVLACIGEPHVFSMEGFMLGYRLCLGMEGGRDERYVRFREWLRERKNELPLEGWYTKYLADCGGDHLRAIRKLLDLATEFHAQGEPEVKSEGVVVYRSPAVAPTLVGTDSAMDALLLLRCEFRRVLMYIGLPNVLAMNGFILGYQYRLRHKGHVDERYERFLQWLRTAGHEPLPEGWYVKYLADRGGDHLQAIRKLLDLAAEFHAQVEHGTSQEKHI